jgi:cystathionine beta-synthase
MIHSNLLETIGNTPIVRLNRVIGESKHQFFAKIEYMNPGGSVKDRVAVAMIEGAEKRGELKPGGTIVEATSGNTGLGLAMVAAIKGYKCIFVMPDKISEEKRAILRAYGARVIITPTAVEPEDPRSYVSVAQTLKKIVPNSFLTNQYHNPDNPIRHFEFTGPEIWKQMDGDIDVFVGGAGTGGTISGVGKYLKTKNPNVKILCADPVGSILYDLFYHKKVIEPPKSYKVEGVGEDMLPDNVQFQYMDDFERVNDAESFSMTRRLIAEEGLCVGPSSALALVAAMKYSQKLTKPSRILVLFPDNGKSYLSKAFNDEWLRANGLMEPLLGAKKSGDVISGINELKLEVSLSLTDALKKLSEAGTSHAKVVNQGAFMGVISESRILSALDKGQLSKTDQLIHLAGEPYLKIDEQMSATELIEKVLGHGAVIVEKAGDQKLVTAKDLGKLF